MKSSKRHKPYLQAGLNSAGIGTAMAYLIYLVTGKSPHDVGAFIVSGALFGFVIGLLTFVWDRMWDLLLPRILGYYPLPLRVFNFAVPTFVVLTTSAALTRYRPGLASYSNPLLISAFASLGVAALYGTIQYIHETFGKYVGKNIRDKVLGAGGEAHAAQLTAAVVFMDVRDSTAICERLPAEQFVALLNEVFEVAVGIIQEHNGVVGKFMGDALMAFWADGFGSGQPCVDAAFTALQVSERIDALNGIWQQKYGCTIGLGIGLHYGKTIAGNIGSPDRKEFTLMGDTVNTAKRLEELSKETRRRTNVSGAFLSCLDSRFPSRHLGNYQLKGKSQPEAVYTLDLNG